MNTIDTHSHFNLGQFDEDLFESIIRMQDAGVGTICVGVDTPTSEVAVNLAKESESIWACVGQHPTEWSLPWEADRMHDLAQDSRVVAIGECGLDYFRESERTDEAKEKQRALFMAQIELAAALDKPLMLHIRPETGTMNAYEDALDILEEYQKSIIAGEAAWQKSKASVLRGTAHFFVGNKVIADRFLALGFHISFSGVITFVKEYEEIVEYVPLDRILSETDAPFAAPTSHRGKRNEPAYVVEIVKKIAQIKKMDLEAVQKQLLLNAKTLFSL